MYSIEYMPDLLGLFGQIVKILPDCLASSRLMEGLPLSEEHMRLRASSHEVLTTIIF